MDYIPQLQKRGASTFLPCSSSWLVRGSSVARFPMRIQNLRNVARDALLRQADPWEVVQVDGLTTTVEHMATLVLLYDLAPRTFNRERKRLSTLAAAKNGGAGGGAGERREGGGEGGGGGGAARLEAAGECSWPCKENSSSATEPPVSSAHGRIPPSEVR